MPRHYVVECDYSDASLVNCAGPHSQVVSVMSSHPRGIWGGAGAVVVGQLCAGGVGAALWGGGRCLKQSEARLLKPRVVVQVRAHRFLFSCSFRTNVSHQQIHLHGHIDVYVRIEIFI